MSTVDNPRRSDDMHDDYAAPRAWSAQEYLRLAEAGILRPDERVELVEGQILQRAPQKNRHVAAVTLATRARVRCFPCGFWVRVQATLALDTSSMPEPDVAVVRGELAEHTDDYPITAELVVEASDATLPYDRGRKASLYARAGIREYWIQNLVDGLLEVRRDPQPVASAPCGWDYATVTLLRPGQSISPLAAPDCTLVVSELLP